MRVIRSVTTILSTAALLLVASGASAQNVYSLSGKFTSNRGLLINIPVVGNTVCANDLTIMSGPGGSVVPMYTTPASRTMTMGANVQTDGMGATILDLGCVAHASGVTVSTSGGGVGAPFTVPPGAFHKPLPGYTAAVEVKYAPPVIQLATSFQIDGPLATKTTPPQGTMYPTFPAANFRAFRAGAWTTQTGRAGSMFTWCFGNAACTNIGQATRPIIVKYTGGTNTFGGTMAYVITSGPNVSSLAVGAGGGAVGFAILAGMGSQPTGRGYAEYLTDMLAQGPLWGAYQRMTVTRPNVGMQLLITMVTGYVGMVFPAAYNYNYGFPFTTGTVVARNTGTNIGNPAITTISAAGYDTVTTMGNRNISLVAGAVAATSLGTNTPNMAQMLLSLPEPGATAQLLAGVMGLLGIAAWRSRKSR